MIRFRTTALGCSEIKTSYKTTSLWLQTVVTAFRIVGESRVSRALLPVVTCRKECESEHSIVLVGRHFRLSLVSCTEGEVLCLLSCALHWFWFTVPAKKGCEPPAAGKNHYTCCVQKQKRLPNRNERGADHSGDQPTLSSGNKGIVAPSIIGRSMTAGKSESRNSVPAKSPIKKVKKREENTLRKDRVINGREEQR